MLLWGRFDRAVSLWQQGCVMQAIHITADQEVEIKTGIWNQRRLSKSHP